MTTHYAELILVHIDPNGNVIDKNKTTILQNLHFSTQHRVLPDAAISNTANYPDIKTYLNLEAAAGYIPVQVAQSFILTYHP